VGNNKLQITNNKIIIPLLLLMLLAFGCTKVDKPVRGEEGSGPMAIVIDGDAPESHVDNVTSEGVSLKKDSIFKSSLEGLDYWKAFHPTLVTGTHNPALTADPDETCLDCHDQQTSCNNCLGYVGVKLVTGDE
jgi:hypothetical protein